MLQMRNSQALARHTKYKPKSKAKKSMFCGLFLPIYNEQAKISSKMAYKLILAWSRYNFGKPP